MSIWKRTAPQAGPQEEHNRALFERDLATQTVEATAAGGAIMVRADGRGRIRHLTIDPAAFEGRDHELLADLILGAVAEAQRRAALLAEDRLDEFASGRP